MKIKTTEIPNRAKHLYMQIYCEKKGGKTNENLINAAQSWLSLSLTKKQYFYDTISTKFAVKKAQRIIKTKPFLRSKYFSNALDSQEQINNEVTDCEHATEHNLDASVYDEPMEYDINRVSFVEEKNVVDTLSETSIPEAERNIVQERAECEFQVTETEPESVDKLQNCLMSIIDEDTDSIRDENSNEKNAEVVPLSEPIIPTIKKGKDLYELLKTRNGLNKPYESLTMREKGFYGNAVRAIKRDFVKKYKEYLESLSSRQLFDYYMKTLR